MQQMSFEQIVRLSMTVRDLIECSYFVKNIEVVIRENGGGTWIQGFRIGTDAMLYRYEQCAEHREERGMFGTELYKLKDDEILNVKTCHNLPMKIMCIEPKKAPKEVLDLVVHHYQPRHIPYIHGESATHNDFDLNIDAFPPERMEKLADYREVIETKLDDQLEGQMSIEDFIGGEND